MRKYLVGVGSNINPQANIVQAIAKLLPLTTRCALSRIIQTDPIDLLSDHKFFNLVIYLETDQSAADLQSFFHALEGEMGRDRSDPLKKVKDRPIDLDIITEITPSNAWHQQVLEEADHFRPIMFELLALLQLGEWPPESVGAGVALQLKTDCVGLSPLIIR